MATLWFYDAAGRLQRTQRQPASGEPNSTITDNVILAYDAAGNVTGGRIEQIKGNVEDRDAFLKAMRSIQIKAPRGPLKLDEYDNPIQNVYISRIQKIKHPVLGEVLTNVPVKTYEAVSQFWTWKPEEFLKRGPYKR